MGGTVVNNLTTIADADSLSPTTPIAGAWTSDVGSPVLDTELYREATGSIAEAFRSVATHYLIFTRTSGTWDFTDTHVYIWMFSTISKYMATLANHGIEIRIGDGTNVGYWTVGGSNTYGGGWVCWVVNTARAFDRNSGTAPTLSAITNVGIAVTVISSPRNVDNTWVDIIRYGNSGLTIYGGTEGSPATFEVLEEDDKLTDTDKAYGVIRETAGAYALQGPITIGDSAGTNNTYFKDTNQVIMFEDKPVSSTLYEIKGVGNATGTTEIYLGAKSGTAGISGCFIKSAGTAKFKFTFTDTNITKFGVYGCSLVSSSTIEFQVYNANKEVLNTNFVTCSEVLPHTTIMTNCIFISAAGKALRFDDIDCIDYITKCTFIACQTAIEMTASGTYDPFTDIYNVGNTYDIENTTASAIIINESGTSNVDSEKINNSGGGTTTVNLNVSINIYTKDAEGDDVTGIQVVVETVSNKAMAGAQLWRAGPVWADQTADANDAGTNDMTLFHSSPTAEDKYYFGGKTPFSKLVLNIGQAGVGSWTIVWEYWDGDSWEQLTLVGHQLNDGTNQFKNSGTNNVTFSPPTDWAASSENSITAYWIRARLSVYTSMDTQPLGTQAWVILQIINDDSAGSPSKVTGSFNYGWGGETSVWIKARKGTGTPKYIPVKTVGTILSTGLSATVSLSEDLIAQ